MAFGGPTVVVSWRCVLVTVVVTVIGGAAMVIRDGGAERRGPAVEGLVGVRGLSEAMVGADAAGVRTARIDVAAVAVDDPSAAEVEVQLTTSTLNNPRLAVTSRCPFRAIDTSTPFR